MRVDVQKFVFIGIKSSLDPFLHEMQRAGKVQFVVKQKMIQEIISGPIYDIFKALRILAHYEESDLFFQKEDEHHPITIRNPFSFSSEIIRLHTKIEAIDADLKILNAQSLLTQFFGEIPWNEIQYIEEQSSLTLQFFEGATNRQFDMKIPELIPIQESGEKSSFISLLPIAENSLPSGLRKIARDELFHVHEKKTTLLERRKELEKTLHEKSSHKQSLRQSLYRESNQARFQEAKEKSHFEVENKLFVITGWAPISSKEEISYIAGQYHVISEEILAEKDEIAPTYLANKGISRIGEDLVHIYDTPSNKDKDPSLWVILFFSLFFAMIVCDAGYGLFFLGIGLFYRMKKKGSQFTKRMGTLFTLLGTTCIGWGLLFHSFFGITLSNDNPLKQHSLLTYLAHKKAAFHLEKGKMDSEVQKWSITHHNRYPKTADEFLYSLDTANNSFEERYSDSVLFELSLFIGTLHLILGMLWYIKKQPSNLGWILFTIGAYLYIPTYLEAISLYTYAFGIDPVLAAHIGFSCIVWGSFGAIAYGIWHHGITGIFECMTAVQLFADILSYLRLYALGLSGALVAKIINDAASTMPFIIGFFIIIFSHAINIILATAGGVIHGLRLNFLEWYHYAFEGGGRIFTPLECEELE